MPITNVVTFLPKQPGALRRRVLLVLPFSLVSVALMWSEGQRTRAAVLLGCLLVLAVWGGFVLPRFLRDQSGRK